MSQTMAVVCPAGLMPGQQLQIQTQDGTPFLVELPQGITAGMTLHVDLPTSGPPPPGFIAKGFLPFGTLSRFQVVRPAKIRQYCDPSSKKVGELRVGESVVALEVATPSPQFPVRICAHATGQPTLNFVFRQHTVRIKIDRGWVSEKGKNGVLLLQRMADPRQAASMAEPEPEPEVAAPPVAPSPAAETALAKVSLQINPSLSRYLVRDGAVAARADDGGPTLPPPYGFTYSFDSARDTLEQRRQAEEVERQAAEVRRIAHEEAKARDKEAVAARALKEQRQREAAAAAAAIAAVASPAPQPPPPVYEAPAVVAPDPQDAEAQEVQQAGVRMGCNWSLAGCQRGILRVRCAASYSLFCSLGCLVA